MSAAMTVSSMLWGMGRSRPSALVIACALKTGGRMIPSPTRARNGGRCKLTADTRAAHPSISVVVFRLDPFPFRLVLAVGNLPSAPPVIEPVQLTLSLYPDFPQRGIVVDGLGTLVTAHRIPQHRQRPEQGVLDTDALLTHVEGAAAGQESERCGSGRALLLDQQA